MKKNPREFTTITKCLLINIDIASGADIALGLVMCDSVCVTAHN